MFSNDLDRIRHPLLSRGWGIVLGSLLMVTVAAALVSARTIPFLFAVTVGCFLAAAAYRGKLALTLPRWSSVSIHAAIFIAYAALSAAWAPDPLVTLLQLSLAALIALGAIAMVQLFADETYPNLLHMAEGLWIGLLVALLYFLAEIVTHQSIKIWIYNTIHISPSDLRPERYFRWANGRLVAVSSEDLTRNAAPITLFLWPAVLAAKGTLAKPWGTLLGFGIVLLAGVVVTLSPHESSKMAWAAGLATFGSALVALRLTARLAAVGWVCVCLAVLPAALIAHRLDLHNATWLQASARHRIIIWNFTAEQVLKAPLLGIGAEMTYVIGPQLSAAAKTHPDEAYVRTLNRHAHSIYLQTWFELGLVGATLLALFGLVVLRAIKSLERPLQPFAYATFACAALVASTSYGMWQIWFMAMFGLCFALFGLGCSVWQKKEREPGRPQCADEA